ncbi:MAG: hypothetical protein ACI9NT_001640 [Bacteroidia bacterium]|jgi:hypothetical protein
MEECESEHVTGGVWRQEVAGLACTGRYAFWRGRRPWSPVICRLSCSVTNECFLAEPLPVFAYLSFADDQANTGHSSATFPLS